MELQKTAIVALGQFNPAILTPPWMFQQNLIEKTEATTEHPVGLGVQFARHKAGEFSWIVGYDRLAMEHVGPKAGEETTAAALVRRILKLLPHTPVHAIGNNFAFSGFRYIQLQADVAERPLNLTLDANGYRLSEFIHTVTTEDPRGIQVQIRIEGSPDSTIRQVLFNFHRNVRSIDDADAALKSASEDLEAARKMMKALMEESS
ncbi:MAG: hypothetical protein D6681_05520 [Calditrichaeota bacterium]|nr:MAG: hypothetical protein D6681_05520 [Calditrichota bacterium]